MSDIKTLEMPKWGLSMEEGSLLQWLLQVGDAFSKGQELCEIETSKIVNVFEAPFAGSLRRILVNAGTTVAVGAPLALVADASVSEAELDAFVAQIAGTPAAPSESVATPESAVETVAASSPSASSPPIALSRPEASPAMAAAATATPPALPASLRGEYTSSAVLATSHAHRLAQKLGLDLAKVTGHGRDGRISVEDIKAALVAAGGCLATPALPTRMGLVGHSQRDDTGVAATPVARRLAAKLGINLHDCRATASQGRVGREDVQYAAMLRDRGQPASPTILTEVAQAPFESLPMVGMRRAIASRLQASKRNAPHFRLTVDVDLEHLLSLRQEINNGEPGLKVSVNDLIVKACAHALQAVPDVNIQYDEASQSILRFADADIAVAVALPSGLITPIVRAAQKKSVGAISRELHALVTKAKAGTLKPDEFQGGSFSVSNLGMLGIKQFDAIINPPQAAILAIGAGEARAVVRDGQLLVRQQATLSLSCDHRVIDGALGAQFLQALKRAVETPSLMLV